MRSFSIIPLIIFLTIYVLISIGAYKNIILLKPWHKQKTKLIWLSLNILLWITFIILYVYPFKANKVTNYPFYFYFNAILFADFLAKIPLAASLLLYYLFKKQNSRKKFLYSGVIFSMCIILTICFGVFIEKQSLRITKFELEFDDLPVEFQDYKIVQLSDTHVGSFLKSSMLLDKTAKAINKIDPDILLFTGDLVNNYANELYSWKNDFINITTDRKSYSILGNHDYGDYTRWLSPKNKQDNFNELLNIQKDIGFQLLRNENVAIKEGKDSIYLVGVENWGHRPFPQYANLNKAMQNIPPNAFTILMTHDPAHWEVAKNVPQIRLVFSGHTHGLQWGIKPAGIVFSLISMTRINWGGLYRSDNSYLVVNTGLGIIGIEWRIDMPPEITVVTLKRREIN